MTRSPIVLVLFVGLFSISVLSKPAKLFSQSVQGAPGALLGHRTINAVEETLFYDHIWIYYRDKRGNITRRELNLHSVWINLIVMGALVCCSFLCAALGVIGCVRTRRRKRDIGESTVEERNSTEDEICVEI